jgi:hypothetical protein
VSRDFRLQGFSYFPQDPEYPIRPFQNSFGIFEEIFAAQGAPLDTGGKLKKSSLKKSFIILSEHLWVVEFTYKYIFSFKSL